MWKARSIRLGVLVLALLMVSTAVAVGQPNWSFSGPTGADNTILGQGEGLLVYPVTNPATGNGDIWLAGGDGRLPINLTNTPNIDETTPSITLGCQQGGLIAFASNQGYPAGEYAIWTMNPDGTGRRQITFPAAGEMHAFPLWTARCTELAFTKVMLGTIHIVNLNSMAVRTVALPNFLQWLGGSGLGSGTMVNIRAIDQNWVTTSIRIGLNHHAWLYVLDDPTDGAPCRQIGRRAGECGLANINLALRLDNNPGCHVLINSYTPVYIDTNFLNQNGCWNGQAGWLEMKFGDTEYGDNSGGVIVVLMPVAR